MMQSTLSAKSAVIAQQRRLDTIANNIANVNTTGFKASNVNFKDTLYNTLTRPIEPQDTNLQRGTGVMISAITRSFASGTPIPTNVFLDACITSDGFFTVRNAQGDTLYTRNGSFAVSSETGGRYLVTGEGYYVLNDNGDKIELPTGDITALSISGIGELSIGNEASFATLGISCFDNNEGLEAVGQSCFKATVASGEAQTKEDPVVLQGFLESSNVDLATEMTKLIRAQKAFAFAATALTTADEMDAIANNMRP